MRRIFILTLFTALVMTMVAWTNRLGKVTGLAQQALMEQRGRQVAASRGTAVADNRRLTAFVRVARHEADEVLRRHHCRILAQTGDISIVSIPLNALETLAQEPAVGRIEAGGRAQTMLDTTLTDDCQCQAGIRGHRPSSGFYGRGCGSRVDGCRLRPVSSYVSRRLG